MPYEFLSWRLTQTYYVQIKEGQSDVDPNYSSSAYGPGDSPSTWARSQSRLRLRPTPDLLARLHARVRRELPARSGA